MRPITTILFLTFAYSSFSQVVQEKELRTNIKAVTVFLSGAQIFETGTITVPAGKSILKIRNLSPFLDDKSIQVKAEGDFTILSVNHSLNYLTELKKGNRIDSLTTLVDAVDRAVAHYQARLEVLSEKQSLLNANKNLGGQNSGATVAQLKVAMEFYEAEITRIKEEQIQVQRSIMLKTKEKTQLENQLRELNQQKSLPGSEVEIRISAEKSSSGSFDLTYLVANAGWFPKYDIRVDNVKSPLELTYKAEVFQNTGIDWKNVKLKFSNGTPNQSGVVPELTPWKLNFARNTVFERSIPGMVVPGSIRNVSGKVVDQSGQPLPGVSVTVQGSTIGTVTDAGGNYNLTLPNGARSLVASFVGYRSREVPINQPQITILLEEDVMALSEVMVVGYGLQGKAPGVQPRAMKTAANIVSTTVVENQTTVEIEVETPYSIAANGEKLLVDLKKYEIKADYHYYAIPKLEKDVFLTARVTDWDQYNLLEGEANLYFEDAYVGRSVLDAKSLQDTLTISLGRDKSIVVEREKSEQFSRTRSIGSNTVETRGFKITIRNKKSQPIQLTLFDQIPVSVISDISVSATELSNGKLTPETGKVSWDFTINPQQQKDITLQYEVKYPRKEKVILD